MGTWAEWTHVLADAGYSAVFMFILIWGLNRRGEDGSRQNLLTFVAAFYFGAAYGLQHTFHSRLLHWPLSIVSTVTVISYLGVVLVFRRQVASNWRRDGIPSLVPRNARWEGLIDGLHRTSRMICSGSIFNANAPNTICTFCPAGPLNDSRHFGDDFTTIVQPNDYS